MQAEIAAQARRTQAQSSQQMVLAAEQASRRLTERVGPLTREALTGAKQRLSVYAALILVAFCLLGAASALLLAGRIVRPVILLARQTREIAAGNLSGRVEADAADEIGDLAVAFNTMAESLQKSRAELQGAEAQLVQSAKLASLGTLSAGVAHELNQPVAIIRGVAQQLQGEPGLNEDVMADLDLIEGQTSRMMKIIKHLRTFSRVGAEERSEVAVNDVVRDCFVLIEAQLRAHDVAVEFDLCEGAPAVLADANELEQVFLNLITNARDANEGNKDARLTIRSRVEGGGRFVLTFADNGTGIPEGVLSHIFDPFFTTKEPGKGTGLGLSISHTIINKHGGTIAAHNDGGAVFTITLPLAETDTLADVAAAAGPQAKAA
jgi:C4-dicarboxylate-specific signal transduction histidine kinase